MRLTPLIILLVLLSLGTWKQLQPNPFPEPLNEYLSIFEQAKLIVAKGLHLCGYASFALLAWIVFPTSIARGGALILLVLHAVGTEIGQTYVHNRTGQPSDVLINWTGLFIGTLLGLRWDAWHVTRIKMGKGQSSQLEVSTDGA